MDQHLQLGKMNPSTKLGRPPPNGKPGYNPDLILMDLDKLRASASYRTFFNEQKLTKLVKQYKYHAQSELPSLGDMINLMAVDSETLFFNMGCEWNRRSTDTHDAMDQKYNVCHAEHIHVWNGSPNHEKLRNETSKHGRSKKLVPKSQEVQQEYEE